MRAPLLAAVVVVAVAAGCTRAAKPDQRTVSGGGAEAEPSGGCPPAQRVPGGIADGDRLFLRGDDRIEAVDLASGATMWLSPNAEIPLAVSGDRLVAASTLEDEPGRLKLSLHTLSTGALISYGPVLELGAAPSSLGGAFCGDSTVEVRWAAADGTSAVRADLSEGRVLGPGPSQAELAVPAGAQVGALDLRQEGGVLRAYAADGALRWERPLIGSALSLR